MKIRNSLRNCASLCIIVFAIEAAADEKQLFRFFKPLPSPEQRADIARIPLDSEIYNSTSMSLGDIRLLDADGSEIPFAIAPDESPEKTVHTKRVKSEIVSLKKLDGNAIEIIVKSPDSPEDFSGIDIDTRSRNYEKQISVQASDDMTNWTQVCSDNSIFDYSEFADLSNSSISFPKIHRNKYFKILISNFSEEKKSPRHEFVTEKRLGSDFSVIEKISVSSEPLRLDNIFLIAKTEKTLRQQRRKIEYQAKDFSVRNLPDATEIFFSTRMEPLDSVVLETESANFARECRVYASDDGKSWQELSGSRGKIKKVKISNFYCSDMELALNGRHRHLKISITNGDAPPLEFTGVKLFGSRHMLEFILASVKSPEGMKIYYGNPEITAPSYDVGEIIGSLKNPSYIEIIPGAEIKNPDFSKGASSSSFLSGKHIFYVFIAVMIIFLSFTLFKSFKTIELKSNDNSGGSQ